MKPKQQIWLAAVLSGLASSAAATDIYKCTDDLGNVMYSQTPCADEAAVPSEPGSEEPQRTGADADEGAPAVAVGAELPVRPRDPANAAACRKHIRDEIDRIFLQLGNGVSAEVRRTLREEALALTQALRRC